MRSSLQRGNRTNSRADDVGRATDKSENEELRGIRLERSTSLASEHGLRAMVEAAAACPAVLDGLRRCADDLQRSVWLFLHHRALFDRAWWLDQVKTLGYSAMHYQVGQGRASLDGAALEALCREVGVLYLSLYRRGDRCAVRSAQQRGHVVSILMDVTDAILPGPRAVAQRQSPSGAELRYGSSDLEIALDYVPASGHLRVFLRGHRFVCEHGHEFDATPSSIVRTFRECPVGSAEQMFAQLCARAAALDIVCLDDGWKRRVHAYRFRCSQGHEWRHRPVSIACPQCGSVNPTKRESSEATIENLHRIAKARGGQCLSEVWLGR